MSASLLVIGLYAFVGLIEWSLALTRTIFTIKGNRTVVPVTVLLETLVAMLVFKNFVQTDDWMIAVAYSVGSALGSLIPMVFSRRRNVTTH
jgi:uncharacterized protein YebE (UPF0316 family)